MGVRVEAPDIRPLGRPGNGLAAFADALGSWRRADVKATVLDLGTYRTGDGDLIHLWYDALGTLIAERDGRHGREPVDPTVVTSSVKVSDDPYWPDEEPPVQTVLWKDMT